MLLVALTMSTKRSWNISEDRRTRAQPAGSLAQPARMVTHSTSTDVLSDMRRCIVWANAEDYNSWKISHPNAKEETTINVINHLQSSMRAAFHNSAEQPASRGIPMEVLTGWLILKCDFSGASVGKVMSALCALANAEHRLFRMIAMVDEADALSEEREFSAEAQIDHGVLHFCLYMCTSEVAEAKDALKALFQDEMSCAE